MTARKGTYTIVKLADLHPSPHNPRRQATKEGLAELAKSIAEIGVLEPLLIHETPDGYKSILAGHRRAEAAKAAGLADVPAMVHNHLTTAEAIEITVTENLQREDLTPMEEAAGLASLQEAGWTIDAIAQHLGKTTKWVARRLSLRRLSKRWLKAAQDPNHPISTWPAASLEVIARLDPDAQDRIWDHGDPFNDITQERAASLADVEVAIAGLLRDLSAAPFPTDDPTLDPKVGACTTCDQRASCRRSLFEKAPAYTPGRVPKGDRCLNGECFDNKMDTWRSKREGRKPPAKKREPAPKPKAPRTPTPPGATGDRTKPALATTESAQDHAEATLGEVYPQPLSAYAPASRESGEVSASRESGEVSDSDAAELEADARALAAQDATAAEPPELPHHLPAAELDPELAEESRRTKAPASLLTFRTVRVGQWYHGHGEGRPEAWFYFKAKHGAKAGVRRPRVDVVIVDPTPNPATTYSIEMAWGEFADTHGISGEIGDLAKAAATVANRPRK